MAPGERQRTGAFFTPFSLVERVSASALAAALGDDGARALAGEPLRPARARVVLESLDRLTVLDPACGSGAFLVHALERIAALRSVAGDGRDVSSIRRDVLTRSIFGVDVNPTAVWLCELRLWLSVVIESERERSDRRRAAAEPRSQHSRRRRALRPRVRIASTCLAATPPALRTLRERYARSTGRRKASLPAAARARRACVARSRRSTTSCAPSRQGAAIVLVARRGRDLFGERYQPSRDERRRRGASDRATALRASRRRFATAARFRSRSRRTSPTSQRAADSASSSAIRRGYALHRIPQSQRAIYRRDYDVARAAAWEPGAAAAGAGRGFAAQVDVAALFVERSLRLLAARWHDGAAASREALAFSRRRRRTPLSRRWRAHRARRGPRRASARSTRRSIRRSSSRSDASTTRLAQRTRCSSTSSVHVNATTGIAWRLPAHDLPFDASRGAPWLLLPPDARRGFDRLRELGRPLAESELGRPRLGVKCGCNDAFVRRDSRLRRRPRRRAHDGSQARDHRPHDAAAVAQGRASPPLDGAAVVDAIIWTHDMHGSALRSLPTRTERWLSGWRRQLAARSDARDHAPWWSLFRTEAAATDRARVVWGDVGREPRASVLLPGDTRVPLNTCYVVRCPDASDAFALAALLNGPLARAWLDALAEPARGGYRRYLGWTMSLLPIPIRVATCARCPRPARRVRRVRPPAERPGIVRRVADGLWCGPARNGGARRVDRP